MKKLVILLALLAAAGTAAWLIYRKTPSGPEDKPFFTAMWTCARWIWLSSSPNVLTPCWWTKGTRLFPARSSPRWKRCGSGRPQTKPGR